jgi:L-seryl-tRNA(Ser) seleniumtransferase
MSDTATTMASLPSISLVLQQPDFSALDGQISPERLVEITRDVVESVRQSLLSNTDTIPQNRPDLLQVITGDILHRIAEEQSVSLQPVINGTGIILHTGLGRAPLHPNAIQAMQQVAENYCNLEVDRQSGERGNRQQHVEKLLCALTGAEAALVVNNNAAAIVVALNALAHQREVIVSRGELVEIGGSFRIPDIMERAGVVRVEVGTTNRTRLEDYCAAVSDNTGALLSVHTSNYRVVGFTQSVAVRELVALGQREKIPVMHDVGSGALIDLRDVGLPHEPVVSDSIKQGVDLVMFSGDKLLGGPQCGILAGRRDLIRTISKNPLARAVRCDKMSMAALEATLQLYMKGLDAVRTLPIYRMSTISLSALAARGKKIIKQLPAQMLQDYNCRIIHSEAAMGSGSLPIRSFPSRALACHGGALSVNALALHMRSQTSPIWGRIQDDQFLLDLRTIQPSEIPAIVHAFQTLS